MRSFFFQAGKSVRAPRARRGHLGFYEGDEQRERTVTGWNAPINDAPKPISKLGDQRTRHSPIAKKCISVIPEDSDTLRRVHGCMCQQSLRVGF